ncbi:MAG TPA: TRAP transporter small permease, partial [Usitatibacter sp.]|nr:TRAP transporter small permease [Usitatibacter sp.]
MSDTGGRNERSAALRAIDGLAQGLVAAALLGELAVVLSNVLARAWLHHSFLWADEVARFALSVLAFIGGAVAYRRREHAVVSLALDLLPKRTKEVCLALADVLVLFTAVLAAVASIDLIDTGWNERTPILQLPAALIAMPLPVGMTLIALYAIVHLWRNHRRDAWAVGPAFAVAVAIAAATRSVWMGWFTGDVAIGTALALFFVAIFAGVPVGFVLLLSTVAYLWSSGGGSLVIVPQ